MSAKCCVMVPVNGMNFSRMRHCQNPVVAGGYCAVHDPSAARRRAEEKQANQQTESEARQRAHVRAGEVAEACRGIAAPVLALEALKRAVRQIAGYNRLAKVEHHNPDCGCDTCLCLHARRLLGDEIKQPVNT